MFARLTISVFLFFGFMVTAWTGEPIQVSMIQLIASGQKYHGKQVRVIGFLNIEFEGNILYVHQQDLEHSILGNGIWIAVTPDMEKQRAFLSKNYCILEGKFSSRHTGQSFSGALYDITRCDLWSERGKPLRKMK